MELLAAMMELLGGPVGTALIWLGAIVGAIGYCWTVGVSFETSLPWGLACFIIPPVVLIWALTHWSEGRKPFFILIAGLGICGLGLWLGGNVEVVREGMQKGVYGDG